MTLIVTYKDYRVKPQFGTEGKWQQYTGTVSQTGLQ